MKVIRSKGYLLAKYQPWDDNTSVNPYPESPGPTDQILDDENDSENAIIKKWKKKPRTIEKLPELPL